MDPPEQGGRRGMIALTITPVMNEIADTAQSGRFWIWTASLLHLAGFGYVVWDCLRHRRQADSSLIWFVIAWIPLLGPLLYLCFGVDRFPSPRHRKVRRYNRLTGKMEWRMEEPEPRAYWRCINHAPKASPKTEIGQAMERAMNTALPGHPLLDGNRLEPLVSGDKAYPAMLAAIERAQHHIHLQSFIIGNDAVSAEFLDTLLQKARQGVRVRVLYDRFGSTHASLEGFFRKYRRQDGMQVVGFTQANPVKRQFSINLRNHRKILVVDGAQAFTGGTNLAIENTTHNGEPPIQDYHFAAQGPIVHELQYTFLLDWCFMTNEDPGDHFTDAHFPTIHTRGESAARLINSGPIQRNDALPTALFLAITQARKQILVVTPYFVPTDDILKALVSAALRGVDVRLIVPQKNNHTYAGLASRALYEPLLESGAQIFERRPPFSHAKALVVDHVYSLIGSANLDVRSLRLNYETCLEVHDQNFAGKLKSIILEDQSMSDPVLLDQWLKRPPSARLLENAASLLAPML